MVNVNEDMVKAMISIIDMSAKAGVFVGSNITVAGQVRSELERLLQESEKVDENEKCGDS